jgi:hypothetical protein
LQQARVDIFDYRQEQRVLGLEVVVDHADVGSSGLGDLAQRRAVDALGEEQLARRAQDSR